MPTKTGHFSIVGISIRIGGLEYLEDYRGLGAIFSDGARWNSPDIPALYFAATASVAMLEMASYLPSPRLIPSNSSLGTYELPDDTPMSRRPASILPPDWRDFPDPRSTRQLGTHYLLRGDGHLLAVPAGLESIVLASPMRLGTGTIRLIGVEAELCNPRAFVL